MNHVNDCSAAFSLRSLYTKEFINSHFYIMSEEIIKKVNFSKKR